jgi:hypothetical protein
MRGEGNMSRLSTMARFNEPDEKEPEVYSNCWHCGSDLVEGQEIVELEEYFFCNTDCLFEKMKYKTLGDD